MKTIFCAFALVSTAGCMSHGTITQHVLAPSGRAFAEVRKTYFYSTHETSYLVVVGMADANVTLDQKPWGQGQMVFGYQAHIDADVKVQWTDDTHLVVRYHQQPSGAEFTDRVYEYQGVQIDFREQRP